MKYENEWWWRDNRNSKYERWYDALMKKARERGIIAEGEWHHVIPQSLAKGPHRRWRSQVSFSPHHEVVRLTYREHFIAHWLLTKFSRGQARYKMLCALGRMSSLRSGVKLLPWQIPISRLAVSQARKGSKASAEARAKMSASHTGRKHSLETRAKMSISRLGHKNSLETRNKIRAKALGRKSAFLGHKHSLETRDKLSAKASLRVGQKNAMFGRKHSPETRAKISTKASLRVGKNNSFFGRKHSEETCAKFRSLRADGKSHWVGRKHSPETRAKMGAAQLFRRAKERQCKS